MTLLYKFVPLRAYVLLLGIFYPKLETCSLLWEQILSYVLIIVDFNLGFLQLMSVNFPAALHVGGIMAM
jgi:hypothetical protein